MLNANNETQLTSNIKTCLIVDSLYSKIKGMRNYFFFVLFSASSVTNVKENTAWFALKCVLLCEYLAAKNRNANTQTIKTILFVFLLILN